MRFEREKEKKKEKKRGGGGGGAKIWNTKFDSKRNAECSPWIFKWLKVPMYFQNYQYTGKN